MRVRLGDRVAVTNIAGTRVVGVYTREYDGALGGVTLQDGSVWAFGCDAKVEPTEEEPTPRPQMFGESELPRPRPRRRTDEEEEDFLPREHRAPRIDLRGHRELREEYRKRIRYMLLDGCSGHRIADELGVSRGLVTDVKKQMLRE